jgi:hypothetical protein
MLVETHESIVKTVEISFQSGIYDELWPFSVFLTAILFSRVLRKNSLVAKFCNPSRLHLRVPMNNSGYFANFF